MTEFFDWEWLGSSAVGAVLGYVAGRLLAHYSRNRSKRG